MGTEKKMQPTLIHVGVRCCNCSRPRRQDRFRQGRCMSGYRYWRKHGMDRPENERIRSPYEPVPLCWNCQLDFAAGHRTLCSACKQYLQLNGRRRPRYLFTNSCKVCNKPKEPGFAKGFCQICYNYRRKYGKNRSRELIVAHIPLGWCDCGEKAIQIIQVEGLGALKLCETCYAMEQDGL